MEEKTTRRNGRHHAHRMLLLHHRDAACWSTCWSEATRDHFRNSRVEFLKGIRSLIDDRISHISQDPKTGQRVTVE